MFESHRKLKLSSAWISEWISLRSRIDRLFLAQLTRVGQSDWVTAMFKVDGFVVCKEPKNGSIEKLGILRPSCKNYSNHGLMIPVADVVSYIDNDKKLFVSWPTNEDFPAAEIVVIGDGVLRTNADSLIENNLTSLPSELEYLERAFKAELKR